MSFSMVYNKMDYTWDYTGQDHMECSPLCVPAGEILIILSFDM